MAFWLLEGPEKLGAGTGGEGEKAKRGRGFNAFAFGQFVFFNTNNQIGRMIALSFTHWLVFFFVCFVSRLVSFDCLIFPLPVQKTTREFCRRRRDST